MRASSASFPQPLVDQRMRQAAEVATGLIEPGMRVGLGTGRTVAWLLRSLAERSIVGLRCVSTSLDTQRTARALRIPVEPFDRLDRLDLAIDGADQVTDDHWAVKGGHGAQLREKIVAAAADRVVIIVSHEKLVERLHPPVPLELERFGVRATLRRIGQAALRPGTPCTPDGGVLADYVGQFGDPAALASMLDHVPGVAGHGVFGPELIDDVIVGDGHLSHARHRR
jgi:ribose 5-phosphate isomerase A